jgi:hypothetical protein
MQLGQVLSTLFPGRRQDDALTRLRQFRSRVEVAAKDANVGLTFPVDSQKRPAPVVRPFDTNSRAN